MPIKKRSHANALPPMKASKKQFRSWAMRNSWEKLSPNERHARIKSMTPKAKGDGASPARGWKAGWREVGGQRCYFRSRWEANYARYLEWLRLSGKITKWEHEPETFWFEEIRRGVRSYLPDFRVTYSDGRVEYHEVKGWMDDRSNTKIKRMRKYYPNTTLKVISAKAYKVLSARWSDKVPGWEDKSAPRPPALNMPDWLG